MRTRLLRPEFWADDAMASLPPAVRLTFMGLWSLSDDAGFFDWKPRQIAAELYRYQSAAVRERQVEGHLAKLVEARRILPLNCQEHGQIPTMERHRIQSGRHSFGVRDEHVQCPSRRGIPRKDASRSESVSLSVTESESATDAGARNDGSKDPDEVWRQLGPQLKALA